MSQDDGWAGSSWERVCEALFGGDRTRMLAWGRRYLGAYPDVVGPAFHLGAEFRRIIGPRNREHWWRRAVAMLEDRGVVASAALAQDAPDGTGRVGESGAPVSAKRGSRIIRSKLTREEALRAIDDAAERQRRREKGLPAWPVPDGSAARRRGWKREDLWERVNRW